MPVKDETETAKMGIFEYVFLFLLGCAAISGVMKVATWVGLLEDRPSVPASPSPRWSRNECLNRWSYKIRREDPLISDEMLSGDVARKCVDEQSAYEGW